MDSDNLVCRGSETIVFRALLDSGAVGASVSVLGRPCVLGISEHLSYPTISGCKKTPPKFVASNDNHFSRFCGLAGLGWPVLRSRVVLAETLRWLYLAGHLAGAGACKMASTSCFQLMSAVN